MKLTTRLWSPGLVRSLSGLAVLAAAVCVLFLGFVPTEGANPPSAAVQALSAAAVGGGPHLANIDPSAIAGSKSCVECHKSEHAALMKSKHNASIKLIEGGANLARYAEAVDIAVGDVLKDSVCIRCHATPQATGGSVHAVGSVSCESCHGGSVGKPEWLKLHATKGITATQRVECDKAGMIRAPNIYSIAKNCAGCHLVSNRALVNAGHPVTTKWNFELVGGSSGEVRHNFQVDQKVNADAPSLWQKYNNDATVENRRRMKYLVGMLVDLEVTLDYLKDVPREEGKKPFAKGHAKRLKSVSKDLRKLVRVLGDDAPAGAVAAQEAIKAMGRISSFNFKSQAKAGRAAPIVADAARAVAEKHDGSKFAALDELIDREVRPRGTAYTP